MPVTRDQIESLGIVLTENPINHDIECPHMTPPISQYELFWIVDGARNRQTAACLACYAVMENVGIIGPGTWSRSCPE